MSAVATQILRGDPNAIAFVQRLRTLSQAGDPQAKSTLSTVGVAFFQQRYPQMFEHARAHYELLASPSADNRRAGEAELAHVQARTRARDPAAQLQLVILRVLHGALRRPLPGGAQIGYHPMPRMHRPGVSFGQLSSFPMPVIPGLPSIPGFPSIPGIYQIPGYPPFTPQVIADLVSVIQRALMAYPAPVPQYYPPPMMMTEPAPSSSYEHKSFGTTAPIAQTLTQTRATSSPTSAVAQLFR